MLLEISDADPFPEVRVVCGEMITVDTRNQEQQGQLYLPMFKGMSSKTSNARNKGGALGRGRARYCLIPRDMSGTTR